MAFGSNRQVVDISVTKFISLVEPYFDSAEQENSDLKGLGHFISQMLMNVAAKNSSVGSDENVFRLCPIPY